ncbi:MAG: tetratricopeptide repeat protein [bacterium]
MNKELQNYGRSEPFTQFRIFATIMNRLEKLQEFLAADPNDSFTRYAIGLEYRSINDFQNAISALEYVATNDPAYVATYYQLAECYRRVDDNAKAKTIYLMGIAQAKKSNDLHTMSELQMAMDELDEE